MEFGYKNKKVYDKNDIVIISLPSTRVKNLTGKKFDKWNVIGYAGLNNDFKSTWWCYCDCCPDKIYKIVGTELSRGKTKSCGCNITKSNKERGYLQKDSDNLGISLKSYKRLLTILKEMKDRCYNPNNKDYIHYGNRNIKICNEWLINPKSFMEWALNNGYQNNLTIERIDVDKGYNPENCTWITPFKQANNKTTTIYVTYENITMTFMDLMRKFNIKDKSLQNKIRARYNIYGWTIEESLKGVINND